MNPPNPKTLREEVEAYLSVQDTKSRIARSRAKTMAQLGYDCSRSHSSAESLTRLEIIGELRAILDRTKE